jgi:hypothetical protein
MPITVTFDLEQPLSVDLNRIRSALERLGWERLGNTAYRYPKLHSEHQTEDWFNHVIPGLMILRVFALSASNSGTTVKKFSIDCQSSTGYNPQTGVGVLPAKGDGITFSSASVQAFGLKNLKDWLDGVEWPYPPTPPASAEDIDSTANIPDGQEEPQS